MEKSLRILITNDDGYQAEGINTLFNVLSRRHDVYMLAPDGERSACSNAINLRTEMIMKKIEDRKWSLTDYPADCVSIAMKSGHFPHFDLVVSGINHGPNLGEDTFFSGTVAGARTAYIFGTSGIAISIDSFTGSEYFDDAAEFLLQYIDERMADILHSKVLLNINYPDRAANEIAGRAFAFTSRRVYNDTYETISQNDISTVLKLTGTIDTHHEDGSDVAMLEKGYISITPLSVACTDRDELERLDDRG